MTFAFIQNHLGHQAFVVGARGDLLLGEKGVPVSQPEAFDGVVAFATSGVVLASGFVTFETSEDARGARQSA